MRIGAESWLVAQLSAEPFQISRIQPALQIGASIDSGSGVTLEIDNVSAIMFVFSVEKMIEPNLQQRGERSLGRDMATDAGVVAVGANHHG